MVEVSAEEHGFAAEIAGWRPDPGAALELALTFACCCCCWMASASSDDEVGDELASEEPEFEDEELETAV